MCDIKDIEKGLENREFFLEYMPIVELHTGRCVGGEALSRWRRPSGVVPPAQFLPSIENTHLSGLLAYYVIEEISKDFFDWLGENDAFISFNVPPEIIGRGGLRYVAERTELIKRKDKIIVEIVERGVPDQIAVDAITRGIEAGIRVALDDVGGEMANPIVLSRCRVEMIKLDRRLVAQIQAGEPLPLVLETIIPLLKAPGLEVVAEGVETAHQAERLTAEGFRLAQGFHFSRPLSPDAFKAYFSERNA